MTMFGSQTRISRQSRRISKTDPAYVFAVSAIERFHAAVLAHGRLSGTERRDASPSDRERLALLANLAERQLQDAEAAVVHALIFLHGLIGGWLDLDPTGLAYLLEDAGSPACEIVHLGRTYGAEASGTDVHLTIDGEAFALPE